MTSRTLSLTAGGRLAEPALLVRPGLAPLLRLLDAEGEQARIVGGAVRDALLGLPVSDVDIATTAEPPEVVRRAAAAGLRSIPTGVEHGTVTVISEGVPYEVTTLRRDVETDGRHAVVRFSRDFAEDAQRRDFTINALSATPDGVLHDTTGGVADLAAGRVRFIGDADRRIAEDRLRILRFFRFHAAYGEGPLDPEGLDAVRRGRAGLAQLSRERVRAELIKLLSARGAPAVLTAMQSLGLVADLTGAPGDAVRFGRLAADVARRGEVLDPVLGLAALAAGEAADVSRLQAALRLSNAEVRRLDGAVAARERLDPARPPPDRTGRLALLFACGPQAAADGVRLASADATQPAAWDDVLARVVREEPPRMPLGGAAVMARGVTDGRVVGAALKALQAAWIRAGFPRDPATLASLLDAAVAQALAGPDGEGPAAD